MDVFLSDVEFEDLVSKQPHLPPQPAIKWRSLHKGTIYKITGTKEISSRYGPGMILEVEDREGTNQRFWAIDRLMRELKGSHYPRFVRPLGLSQCTDPTKSYYSYQLV